MADCRFPGQLRFAWCLASGQCPWLLLTSGTRRARRGFSSSWCSSSLGYEASHICLERLGRSLVRHLTWMDCLGGSRLHLLRLGRSHRVSFTDGFTGAGFPPRWCREDPAACRVGSEGFETAGATAHTPRVRGGSPGCSQLGSGDASLSGCRIPARLASLLLGSWAYIRSMRFGCLVVSCAYTRAPWCSRAAVGHP